MKSIVMIFGKESTNQIFMKSIDLVFGKEKSEIYDGFSCKSKILRRNSTLDLCRLINQHIKI